MARLNPSGGLSSWCCTAFRVILLGIPRMSDESPGSIRIDRWLWAARFYRTRSLAKAAVEGGKVHLDGQRVKPAKDIRVGQSLAIRRGDNLQTVTVTGLSDRRGPAKIAATLYAETAESIETRELLTSKRRMEKAGLTVPSNRPSKRDRREIAKLKNTHDPMEDSFD